MGKVAFVFAGQGAQAAGMGKELYDASPAAKALLDQAETLRKGTLAQCFSGDKQELSLTQNAQPCLMAVDCACAAALIESGVTPEGLAGFSLGEIAAVAMSDMLRFPQAFALVTKRAAFMRECAEKHPAGMAAVLKLQDHQVEAICAEQKAYPVNYNCPGQVVCTIAADRMKGFTAAVKDAGGLVIPLAVSGGFHSPYMRDAAEALRAYAQTLPFFRRPILPLYANATCGFYTAKDAAALLGAQIDHPVRWTELIRGMLADGFTDFIEVGPGATLSGLIRKIGGAKYIAHVEDNGTLEEVTRHYKERAAC